MKRKDWKTKDLKKDIFDKKLKKKLKIKRLKPRFLFLRKLFIRKNKYLVKKNLFLNFFFLKSFLNLYKKTKQNYLNNLFFKTNVDKLAVFPEYSVVKNVINKKNKFKFLKIKYKINLIFLPNKYFKNNFGLNYNIINNNFINLNKFKLDLLEEDNLNLIHFKDVFHPKLNNNFNYFLNYNINNLCLIEIYKIIIILYLKN